MATQQDITSALQDVANQYSALNKPMKLALYCLFQQVFFGDSITVNKIKNLLLTCTPEQKETVYNSILAIYQTEHTQIE